MNVSIPHHAYLLASTLLGPLARPILNRRLARGKEDRDRITERLGTASVARPEGTLIWMHGASVGEAMSMLPLIHALLAARADVQVLVTTGTVTSAQRMWALLPDGAMHQYVPVDTRHAVRGFLDHWRPDLAIWVESELWPRLVSDTAARGIPMALMNARFSENSIRGWERAPSMLRNLLSCFRIIRTQDHETEDRLRPYAPAARFTGNLKALIQTPECDRSEFAALQRAIGRRPVWLAASTHADDEPVAIQAHHTLLARSQPKPLLLLAPRHPERGTAVARAVLDADLTLAIRSVGALPTPDTDVWLADTLGEMGLWYRLAPVTFVGGSFGTAGGHTPFEPMLLDSAIVHGPDVANFASSYRTLDRAGAALMVQDATALAAGVEALLAGDVAFKDMIQAARETHARLMPDLDTMVDEVLRLLPEPS